MKACNGTVPGLSIPRELVAILSENKSDCLDTDMSMELDVSKDVIGKSESESESEESHQSPRMIRSQAFRYALLECFVKIMESDPGSPWLVVLTSLNVGLIESPVHALGSGSEYIVDRSKEEREEIEKIAMQKRLSFERLVKVTLSGSLLPPLLLLLSRTALSSPSAFSTNPTLSSNTDWNDMCASLAAQFLFSSVTCVCEEKKLLLLGLVLPVISNYLVRMNTGIERSRFIVLIISTMSMVIVMMIVSMMMLAIITIMTMTMFKNDRKIVTNTY